MPVSSSSSSSSSFSSRPLRSRGGALLVVARLFCSLRKLKNLCYRHRARALTEAQRALTEYLHATRALPFSHADLIASHSPSALTALVAQVPFPPDAVVADLPRALRRFLSFRPVNEFDFFFESIGLPQNRSLSGSGEASSYSRSIFLADDTALLAAISALAHFGFPWTKLGLLYHEAPSIFSAHPDDLVARLGAFEVRGLSRVCVIGICLAFPSVLAADAEQGGEIDLLFQDLSTVFINYGLAGCVAEDNVDDFLQISKKIRVFYDIGSKKGVMGELMGKKRRIFLELDEALLSQKLIFFVKLGMERDKVGPFLLQSSEILNFDLDNPSIAMPDYLKYVGLDQEVVISLWRKYPYIMGKNKLGNLPAIMCAMGLEKWFLDQIVSGNHRYLSADFASASSNDVEYENSFLEDLERVKCAKKEQFVDNKLEFMLSIGFGENNFTTKAVALLNSTREQLQERFDCLLDLGIEYPMLCRMISVRPKLLNQSKESIQEKVSYLCNKLNYPLEYLDTFPAYLCFDLENRVKPRYKILNWLKELGLLKKPFAPATVLANSERRFMVNLYSVHPAAPKQWLECFSARFNSDGNQRILFVPRNESLAEV